MAASKGESPEAPRPEYIEALFNQYALTFDEQVGTGLDYRAPTALRELLDESLVTAGSAPRFKHALDLGCGTGLSGQAFGDLCGAITGVDVSDGMLKRARDRQLYQSLIRSELRDYLQRKRYPQRYP